MSNPHAMEWWEWLLVPVMIPLALALPLGSLLFFCLVLPFLRSIYK